MSPSDDYPSVVVRRHTHLQFPGKNDGLRRFYDKLHALRTDTMPFSADEVYILHIGGSHVQGGVLSNTIRMQLEPSGDRGICSLSVQLIPIVLQTIVSTTPVSGKVPAT